MHRYWAQGHSLCFTLGTTKLNNAHITWLWDKNKWIIMLPFILFTANNSPGVFFIITQLVCPAQQMVMQNVHVSQHNTTRNTVIISYSCRLKRVGLVSGLTNTVLISMTYTFFFLTDCCSLSSNAVCLLVGCLMSQQHASVSQGRICTIVHAATLRQKLQIKLSTSPSHSILTLGQPVPALTL